MTLAIPPVDQLRKRRDKIDRSERTRHFVPARKDHIGWVILDEDETCRRDSYETAAWYTTYKIKAGMYPVYSISGNLVFYVDDAIKVDENMHAMFGGVPIGGSSKSKTTVGKADGIGKPTRIMRHLPDVYQLPEFDDDVREIEQNRRLVLLMGVAVKGKTVTLFDGRMHRAKFIELPDGRTIT